MKIDYVFTRESIKGSWNYFREYSTISVANARVWYVSAPVISLAILLLGSYYGQSSLKVLGGYFLFSSVLGIPIHVAFDYWKFSNWSKSNFESSTGTGFGPHSLVANDEGLIFAKTGSIETRLAWNAITDFRQNEIITVIYLNPESCVYFPTKAMSAEQRVELGELVARNVDRKKSC
jgi:hypothetical protein